MSDAPIIVWFRQDLRLADQPALAAAVATGQPVLPVYIRDDISPGRWKIGGASRWWLHHSLQALAADLAALGSPLLLRRGRSAEVIAALARETGAGAVYFTRHVEPWWRQAECAIEKALLPDGIAVKGFAGATLFKPGAILNREGGPFKVFTAFWRACLAAAPPSSPLPAPQALRAMADPPAGDTLADWQLLPRHPDWAGGLRQTWQPGEAAARQRLIEFVDGDQMTYRRLRDRPEPAATSRLSPYLHFGEISARQVWHAVAAKTDSGAGDGEAYLRELGWREFYAHVTRDNPDVADTPLQARFNRFAWRVDEQGLAAWQQGRTGYPIVDAGMRQLWQTGWMHNRVRMIVASFLIKHLLLPWQDGEAWFWDTLVDADLANNAGGWQWVAGCGTDAAPYFRIFNPVSQGEKFDADGAYVRRWVPELAAVPIRWLHRPWQAPALELAAAGLRLGTDYPLPIVDHATARARALAAFEAVSD